MIANDNGGVIYADANSQISLASCNASDLQAISGGVVYVSNSDLTLQDNIFLDSLVIMGK